MRGRLRLQLLRDTVPFLILFLAFLEHILVKDGYGVSDAGVISMIPYKYALNLWQELAELADPLIQNNGFIYVEADRDLTQLQLPRSWQQIKNTKAGSVRCGLYQKIAL